MLGGLLHRRQCQKCRPRIPEEMGLGASRESIKAPGPRREREREREPETERVHALRLPSESRSKLSSPPLAPAPPPRPQKHKATEQDSTFRVEMNGLEEKAGNGPRPLLQSPCQGPTKKASRRCLRFFFIPKRTSTSTRFFDVKTVKTQMPRQQRDVEY